MFEKRTKGQHILSIRTKRIADNFGNNIEPGDSVELRIGSQRIHIRNITFTQTTELQGIIDHFDPPFQAANLGLEIGQTVRFTEDHIFVRATP